MAKPKDSYLDRIKFVNILQDHRYIFAKTMPQNPHEYTLRREWKSSRLFSEVVEFIRRDPIIEVFYGKKYSVLYANGMKYWTMGAPVEETILINRAQFLYDAKYSGFGENYDAVYSSPEFLDEDKRLFDLFKSECPRSQDVLDIGCGTGLFLDHVKPETYLGIDPSIPMLAKFADKFKHRKEAKTIACNFEDYYPLANQGFDTVVSLYGTTSYLDPDKLDRIKDLIGLNGRYFMMFYRDGYKPFAYNSINPIKHNGVGGLRFHKGKNIEFTNYVIATGGYEDLL